MADEGTLFEGLRLGSARAFTELLADDGPTMRRLARLYVAEEQVAPLLRQTWAVALPGLDMFTWHTTLRAWLTGILVTYGRAAGLAQVPVPGRAAGRGALTTTAPPAGPSTGPLPWATLRWSGLWPDDGWAVLEDALAALPLPQREVLWLHDVEGWGWREVLDTLGLTAEQGTTLRDEGRDRLAGAVARHLRVDGDAAGQGERHAGVAALLRALLPAATGEPAPPPDPQLLRAFAGWRRRRGVRPWRRWWWELGRRPTRRSGREPQRGVGVATVSPDGPPVGTQPGRG